MAKSFKQVNECTNLRPICQPESLRILLQLSAKPGHVLHQFDVKTAFLHSPIEEEEYLEQPQSFWSEDQIERSWYTDWINQFMDKTGWQKLMQGVGKTPTDTGDPQEQELSLLVREGGDRWSHLHFVLGWGHHSRIKKHDSNLRCQEGTEGNMEDRKTALVSGPQNQTRGQSESRPRALHKQCFSGFKWISANLQENPADLNLKLQTAQKAGSCVAPVWC